MYKIRKINFGWYKRRHGILLENLPPSKQQLILDNDYFRYLNEDTQALEVIFKIEDLNEHEKGLKKLFWNRSPRINKFTKKSFCIRNSKKKQHETNTGAAPAVKKVSTVPKRKQHKHCRNNSNQAVL